MNCRISHPTKNVNCEIQLPSSKSISNRLLIIRSLCKEKFEIKNLSNADDTQILAKALKADKKIIDVKHAGSSFRFLTSFFSLNKGKEYILTGSDRLKKRPIKDLVEILQRMGAKIKYVNKEGFAPLKILGSEIMGGRIEVNGGISSQFITAILLIAPTLDNGIELKIVGNIVSKPYISMTLRVMRDFGIKWTWIDNIITIRKQKYISRNYCVESDWSCASFWFQIASLSKECNIKLNGLKENSLQGDKKIREIFESLGVSSSFEKGKLILTKKKETSLPKEIN